MLHVLILFNETFYEREEEEERSHDIEVRNKGGSQVVLGLS